MRNLQFAPKNTPNDTPNDRNLRCTVVSVR